MLNHYIYIQEVPCSVPAAVLKPPMCTQEITLCPPFPERQRKIGVIEDHEKRTKEVYPTSAVLCIMRYPPFMPLDQVSSPIYVLNEYPPHVASSAPYVSLLCPLLAEHNIWWLLKQFLQWLYRQVYDAQTHIIRQFIKQSNPAHISRSAQQLFHIHKKPPSPWPANNPLPLHCWMQSFSLSILPRPIGTALSWPCLCCFTSS